MVRTLWLAMYHGSIMGVKPDCWYRSDVCELLCSYYGVDHLRCIFAAERIRCAGRTPSICDPHPSSLTCCCTSILDIQQHGPDNMPPTSRPWIYPPQMDTNPPPPPIPHVLIRSLFLGGPYSSFGMKPTVTCKSQRKYAPSAISSIHLTLCSSTLSADQYPSSFTLLKFFKPPDTAPTPISVKS